MKILAFVRWIVKAVISFFARPVQEIATAIYRYPFSAEPGVTTMLLFANAVRTRKAWDLIACWLWTPGGIVYPTHSDGFYLCVLL